jgi:hypothetical protein
MGRRTTTKNELLLQVNRLLAHCPDPECEKCSVIICPREDPLHFHHDGCPSCNAEERVQEGVI